MINLIDPYSLGETWNLILDEDSYSTYLKNNIWITDGELIEEWNCYKTTPDYSFMSSGKQPIYWMLKKNNKKPMLPKSSAVSELIGKLKQ